jgi:hypothetical protein
MSLSDPSPATTSIPQWLAQGLRAGFFIKPRLGATGPTPLQLVLLAVITTVMELCAARFEVAGPATFDARAWLSSWWPSCVLVLLMWWTLAGADEDQWPARKLAGGLAAWFALWFAAALPASLVSQIMGGLQARSLLPQALSTVAWLAWSVYILLWAWTLAVALKLAWHFGAARSRLAVLLVGMACVYAVTVWQAPERAWVADAPDAPERPVLHLSQEVFETQQALWEQAEGHIAAAKPGVANVYGVVFAPYAAEDVFLRESTMVAKVLAERFDAQGRVLHLINHATTAQTLLWATPANLSRAIGLMAQRMDRERDVLVVYMTSHGASNFQLAAQNWPLDVDSVTPQSLRQALDDAGVKNRVIAISACFSGGWVGPLSGESTLVMTAADATHTSYGCGRLSELTFFGRAMFDEELRRTHSFEAAFAKAVPVIKQREIDAGKPDGFSNPQMSVGAQIAPVLKALAQRLDAR